MEPELYKKMDMKQVDEVTLAKKVLKTLENAIEDNIEKIDSMNNQDLEKLREARLNSMKKAAEKTKELLSKGHGIYEENIEEKEFFKVTTDSDRVIAHFFIGNSPLCEVFNWHLKQLAMKHLESRFVSLNAEKSPFLVNRLNIRRFPTVLVIIDRVTSDKIVGDVDFNGKDVTKDALEWRLSLKGGIDYDGDFDPTANKKVRRTQIKKLYKKRTIRENTDSSEDD